MRSTALDTVEQVSIVMGSYFVVPYLNRNRVMGLILSVFR